MIKVDYTQLQPELVWKYFVELTKIPRPSGSEEKVMEWLIDIAQKHGFDYYQDSVNNLSIHVPGTSGYENSEPVILQTHADMVTERAAGSTFDFLKEPLNIYIEDGWMYSKDTTLGADNGVGLCMSLAVALDPEVQHPPLQLLITVEEETTFKGILNLDPKALHLTARRVINLDNEEEGIVLISSAGMLRMSAQLPISYQPIEAGKTCLTVSLKDLPGGHSGVQIHEEKRENAIVALSHFLSTIPHDLVEIHGGDKDNAIPRDVSATIAVSPEVADKLIRNHNIKTDQGYDFIIQVIEKDLPTQSISTVNILKTLASLQNGVISWHPSIDNLVQTSSNLASIKTNDDHINMTISIRSCVNQDLENIFNEHSQILKEISFTTTKHRATPGWDGDPNSELLKAAVQAQKELTGKEASVEAIHAGLEVGSLTNTLEEYLQDKVQSIAIGPNIENPHSPSERVEIQSTKNSYDHLSILLKNLK